MDFSKPNVIPYLQVGADFFERERIHLLLLEDAFAGLDDMAAGRTRDARAVLQQARRVTRKAASHHP